MQADAPCQRHSSSSVTASAAHSTWGGERGGAAPRGTRAAPRRAMAPDRTDPPPLSRGREHRRWRSTPTRRASNPGHWDSGRPSPRGRRAR